MKIKLRYWLLAIVLVGILLNWLNESEKAAMAACEKTHSRDTCFYSLHH